MQAEVVEDLRSVFSAPNRTKAEENLQEIVLKYQTSASKLSQWMERLNREIKRRTKVVGVFPNETSFLRLISSILIDVSEKWEAGWVFLDLSEGH